MTKRAVVVSVLFWVAMVGFLRIVIVPPEASVEASGLELQRAADSARGWMERAQLDDGRYVYLYDAELDHLSPDYNEVRHAGVTMALYQAAGRLASPATLTAADRGLAWMTEHLYRHDGWAALVAPGAGRAKLGASALMLVGLAERRLATGDAVYDPLMREVGSFLAALQRPDGGFHVAWWVERDAADRLGTSRYYPGEALWALALLHEALPGEGWDVHARAAAEFVTTRRDDVETVDFPPLADHWAAYALAEMAEWGLKDAEIAYGRRLAGRFGLLVRTESQREGGWSGTVVRGASPRAGALGTWVEGLAALWRLASADERLADLRAGILERVEVGAAILAGRQVSDERARTYDRPGLVRGAWLHEGATRMDDQQHAFSGLLYAADALHGRTGREPDLPPRRSDRGVAASQ